MSEIPKNPGEALVEMAVKLGYIGLVSHRQTIQEAYDDGVEMLKADDATVVPLHLLMNTMALQWAQDRLNTVEMMDAIISYCEDDSRSPRRREEIRRGAKRVHKQLTGEDYGHVPE